MEGSTLPGLMGNWSDEELNQHTIKHAKYFTVVQIRRGGFVSGGTNYDRVQVPSLEEARLKAAELYAIEKRGILIYAVADFAGANGFSRPVENYPPITYMTKADKAAKEKLERKQAREAAREARQSMGSKPKRAPQTPAEPVQPTNNVVPEAYEDDAFMNSPLPMVLITRD